jgi:hypothetical protein
MNWTEKLLTGWDFMRALRLALGLYIGVQALLMADALSGMIAVFFLYQAVTNTGCCGVQGCAVPTQKQSEATQDVTFQEADVKPKK